MNVILIGYRCTGKSLTGKILADMMENAFMDTDDIIEKTMKASVSSIVSTKGWEMFRKIETQVLKGVLKADDMVIATGGGIILHEKNISAIRDAGTVVWLRASADIILKRMSQDEKSASLRPSLTDKAIEDEIVSTLTMRTPLYKKAAHMEIDTSDMSAFEAAGIIKRRIDHGR